MLSLLGVSLILRERERERERVREMKKERQEIWTKPGPLIYTRTHIHVPSSTNSCVFVFSVQSGAFASTQTQRAFYASDLSLTRTSHSTGMFHSRIFPSVRPEDFMTLMRDAWTLSLWKCDQFTKHDWWGQHTHISPS